MSTDPPEGRPGIRPADSEPPAEGSATTPVESPVPPSPTDRPTRAGRGVVFLVPASAEPGPTATVTADPDRRVFTDAGPDLEDVEPLPDADPAGQRQDWAWVEEWRAGGEPTPWATGLGLSAFSALVVGVAVWVLCAGLVDRPVVAVGINVLVAAGLAPAMWLSRGLPVLRWVAAGSAVGMVVGWLAAILMLPLPLP